MGAGTSRAGGDLRHPIQATPHPRTAQNIGNYSIFGMTWAVQPYSYLFGFENYNPHRSGDLAWLRPPDRTVPMAVLPPYDHGIRTQERRIDNNDRPSTWLLHQDGSDGWAGQIKRSYIHHRRNDDFAGIQWGNQVFFSKPSTWRPTRRTHHAARRVDGSGAALCGPQDCGRSG